jgi:hypothetical protein
MKPGKFRNKEEENTDEDTADFLSLLFLFGISLIVISVLHPIFKTEHRFIIAVDS